MKTIPAVTTGQVQLLQTALILGAVAFAYMQAKKAVQIVAEKSEQALDSAAEFVKEDINPASSENFINRGFNWGMAVLLNEPTKDFSFAGWLYDSTHKKEIAAATAPTPLDVYKTPIDYGFIPQGNGD